MRTHPELPMAGDCVLTVLGLWLLMTFSSGASGDCRFGDNCIFSCHCLNNDRCDVTTGDCPSGCDVDPGISLRGDWGGPACQVGNIAYAQETTASDYMGWSTPSSWAVDGVYDQDKCSIARAVTNDLATWDVLLGAVYVITEVRVYSMEYQYPIIENTDVLVRSYGSYMTCGEILDEVTYITVTCASPLIGDSVRLRRMDDDSDFKNRLILCEVVILGYRYEDCKNNAFGPGCVTSCNCQEQCDVISGRCASDCTAGWRGFNCQTLSSSSAAASSVVVPICIAIIAVAALIWYKRYRRRSEPKQDGEKSQNNPIDRAPSPSDQDDADIYSEVENSWVPHSTDHVYYSRCFHDTSVNVHDLHAYEDSMKEKKFLFEFAKLPKGEMAKWITGYMSIHRGKNRYKNIIAYDHSRVTFDCLTEDRQGYINPITEVSQGYINASFIPSYSEEKGYIACQGPRIHTIEDMWLMIWQKKVNRIVMLTNIFENEKAKCEHYWPESELSPQRYGRFRVLVKHVQPHTDFTIRTLSVTYENEQRTVTQFHFTAWRDHEVPTSPAAILEFRSRVRAFDTRATGPLLVHGSAGVGRTGTFLALDYLLDQAKAEGMVDVFQYTSLMRSCRVNMVMDYNQYIFIYEALALAVKLGKIERP